MPAKRKKKLPDLDPKAKPIDLPKDFDIFDANLPSTVGDTALSGFNFVETSRQILVATRARQNRPTSLLSAAQIQQRMLPFRHFLMQYLFGCYGIPHNPGILFEIIGGDGAGKSSLAFTIAGWAAQAGCPIYWQNTEGKMLQPTRIMRCLHTDPKVAKHFLEKVVAIDTVNSLDQAAQNLEDAVLALRGKLTAKDDNDRKLAVRVPKEIPILVVIDSWSKLMSPDEAEGFQDYSDFCDEKKMKKYKETGHVGNLGHSKFNSQWCRRLPYFMDENNVILLWIHHSTARIDMAGGKAKPLPEMYTELRNRNHVGGRASNQNAAFQLIVQRGQEIRDADKRQIAQQVVGRVRKNSYGAEGRQVSWQITLEPQDRPGYIEPALSFDDALARMLVESKLLPIRLFKDRYTWDAKGLSEASAKDVVVAFHSDSELVKQVGRQLRIEGYYGVDDIVNGDMLTGSAAAGDSSGEDDDAEE